MRSMLSLALLALVGLSSGCHLISGVCDCDEDVPPCYTRAPWVMQSPLPPTPNAIGAPEPITPPAKKL